MPVILAIICLLPALFSRVTHLSTFALFSLSLSLSLSLLCSLAYMKLSNAHLRGGCNNLAKDYERRKAARPTAFFRSSCPILQWDPVEFSLRSVECNLLLACSLTRSFVTRFERIQRRASSLESAQDFKFLSQWGKCINTLLTGQVCYMLSTDLQLVEWKHFILHFPSLWFIIEGRNFQIFQKHKELIIRSVANKQQHNWYVVNLMDKHPILRKFRNILDSGG